MKKILKSLINNRKITLLFVFVISMAGIFNYYVSSKQETPDFSIPYAMITTIYPGANQNDVDIQVTKQIESVIKQVDGYNSSFSYSSSNLSIVFLELDYSADRESSFNQIRSDLLSLQNQLPEQVLPITINTDITSEVGVMLSMTSKDLTHEQINDQAEELAKILASINGVKKFETAGLINEQVVIEVNSDMISKLDLSLSDVYNIVKINNMDLPYGKVNENGEKISVTIDESYKDINDIKEIIVGFNPVLNKTIVLNDVADINISYNTNDTYYIYDDKNTILVLGYFDEDQNILLVGDEIREEIEKFEMTLSSDIELTELLFQPEEVSNSISDFMQNLLFAVALVILVVLIGMGFRNAIIISISIPLSILISFSIMKIFNIEIQQVSIAALIISLGMLVDNSIVISDSIQHHLDEGEAKKKSCIKGSKEVAIPILTSTLTTIAAFAPFLFLDSIAGDFIKALPQIVIISLLASYLVAIFIVPVLGYMFFKPRKTNGKVHIISSTYTAVLKKSMKVKWVVVLLILIAIGGAAYLATQIDMTFFPAADKNIIYIDILNNESDNSSSTFEIADEIGDILDKEDGISYYVTSLTGGLPRFNSIMFVYSAKPDVSQIMMRVDLDKTEFDTNKEYVDDLQNKIDKHNFSGRIVVKQLMYAFPRDEDLIVRISGANIDQIKIKEGVIYNLLANNDRLLNVNKSNAEYVHEYSIDIDKEISAFHGLTLIEVQNEISIATLGRSSSVMVNGNKKSDVIVKGDIETINDIKNINIKSNKVDDYIKLSELITINDITALSVIPRNDGQYSLSVSADYNSEYDKKETLQELKKNIDQLNITDCDISYDGEDSFIRENFGQIGLLAMIALVFVFLILLIQFKSYIQPLIIFITIPLSAVGSIVGLYITKQTISFTALLGIVSLLGIVVNNAIILIDFINEQLKLGVNIKKACIKATSRRLRPIFLSTITTMIGLIPLAFGTSQLFKPLAIALISGLLVSTILTLIVIPVFVSMRKNN